VPAKDINKHFEAVSEASRAAVRVIRAAVGDGEARHGIDLQLVQRVDAECRCDQTQQHNEPALMDREGENARNHLMEPRSIACCWGFAELGFEQEGVADGDLLIGREAGDHLDALIVRLADLQIASLETLGGAHECNVLAVHLFVKRREKQPPPRALSRSLFRR
jgi:hypothetical protein